MLMQINQWWIALDARERKLLSFLAAFIALVLLYVLLWSPLMNAQQQAQLKLNNAQQTWQWLNQQVPLVEQQLVPSSQAKASRVNNQNELLSVVQKSLRQQNLFKDIKTVKGVTQGAEVRFDEVTASRLFRWLARLEQQGVVADELSVVYVSADRVKAVVEFKIR